ncbi:MAG: cation diffusion facilitator family transporter [Chitinispirillia bacterium]|nr:cation diffusion facilitator family transporter [Chitinispirillia bacterium]MCL2241047.1 cation diffusion facilitator family transporter [Chitinispirillia bacterium]
MENTVTGRSAIALANRVAVVTIIINTVLTAFKLVAGIVANSAAMISDAVHTLSDLLTTFIVIVGVNLSGQKPDNRHPYGHERFECVASILLALSLGIVGLGIGYSGTKTIIEGAYDGKIPGSLALIAALVSIAVKEWMYWYTSAAAKKINSGALMADAWHHRSDGLSSIGVFIGIGGAMMGCPILDPIASLIICLFIMKAAYDIFADAINKMLDTSCDDKTVEELKALAAAQNGVIAVDDIRTRIFGAKIFVDVEIAANPNLTLIQSHKISQMVHDEIENKFPSVKHCMVHVNPYMGD